MDTYTSEGDDNSATRFSDEIVEKLTISVRFRNIGRSTSVSVDWVVLEKQRVKDSRFGQNLKMVSIDLIKIQRYESSRPLCVALQCEGVP
jgi:hypothetical protein